jgi:hypothetical protein
VAQGFTEVKMIALRKKPKATKCSDNDAVSLISHTTMTVVRTLRRRD